MLFVDLTQEYDSINREQLLIALRNFRIPNKLVRLIQMCNEQPYCKLYYLEELSTIFEYKTELRQSNALSQVLFNLVVEKVVKYIPYLDGNGNNRTQYLFTFLNEITLLGKSKHDI